MTDELKPCPFCGGTKMSACEGSTNRWGFLACDNCGGNKGDCRKADYALPATDPINVEFFAKDWNERALAAAAPSVGAGWPIDKKRMDALVNRFLGWKLPQTFGPDCFVSFDKAKAQANQSWPVGTNLLTASEARDMLEYVLDASFIPAPFAGRPCDWSEDFQHENGLYECRCVLCKTTFYGHKRRAVCKLCDAAPTSPAVVEGQALDGGVSAVQDEPCPHCGKPVHVAYGPDIRFNPPDSRMMWRSECSGDCLNPSFTHFTREEALENWNSAARALTGSKQ